MVRRRAIVIHNNKRKSATFYSDGAFATHRNLKWRLDKHKDGSLVVVTASVPGTGQECNRIHNLAIPSRRMMGECWVRFVCYPKIYTTSNGNHDDDWKPLCRKYKIIYAGIFRSQDVSFLFFLTSVCTPLHCAAPLRCVRFDRLWNKYFSDCCKFISLLFLFASEYSVLCALGMRHAACSACSNIRIVRAGGGDGDVV